jgi:hypothetical protein
MTTTHAFFSIFVANRDGSSLYRRAGGATLNVTRTSAERDGKGPFPHDEKYLGEVIAEEDGGVVRGKTRVPGISS